VRVLHGVGIVDGFGVGKRNPLQPRLRRQLRDELLQQVLPRREPQLAGPEADAGFVVERPRALGDRRAAKRHLVRRVDVAERLRRGVVQDLPLEERLAVLVQVQEEQHGESALVGTGTDPPRSAVDRRDPRPLLGIERIDGEAPRPERAERQRRLADPLDVDANDQVVALQRGRRLSWILRLRGRRHAQRGKAADDPCPSEVSRPLSPHSISPEAPAPPTVGPTRFRRPRTCVQRIDSVRSGSMHVLADAPMRRNWIDATSLGS
jgi:hypothetical protein